MDTQEMIIRVLVDSVLSIKKALRNTGGYTHPDAVSRLDSRTQRDSARFTLGEINGLTWALAMHYGYPMNNGYGPGAERWRTATDTIRRAVNTVTTGHDTDNTNATEREDMYANLREALQPLGVHA